MKKKILSLEELYKLYGLSPTIISAIKKKKKKRRNKKIKKLNNGTMGNKPADSTHMVGSSTALSIATNQLNQANINKHIKEINDSNDRIAKENNEPNNLHVNNPKIQMLNNLEAGLQSGNVKTKSNHHSIKLTDKTQYKKRGPKPKNSQVEEVFEVFDMNPPQEKGTLSSAESFNIDPNSSIPVDIFNDGFVGSTSHGSGSEKFVAEEDIIFNSDNFDHSINNSIAPDPENSLLLGEDDGEDAVDEIVEPEYIAQPITFYKKVEQLNSIAKDNNVLLTVKKGKSTVNLYTKQQLYDLLVGKKLV